MGQCKTYCILCSLESVITIFWVSDQVRHGKLQAGSSTPHRGYHLKLGERIRLCKYADMQRPCVYRMLTSQPKCVFQQKACTSVHLRHKGAGYEQHMAVVHMAVVPVLRVCTWTLCSFSFALSTQKKAKMLLQTAKAAESGEQERTSSDRMQDVSKTSCVISAATSARIAAGSSS